MGITGAHAGEMNCDGLFNGGDIDAFFLGFGDPALWEITYRPCVEEAKSQYEQSPASWLTARWDFT